MAVASVASIVTSGNTSLSSIVTVASSGEPTVYSEPPQPVVSFSTTVSSSSTLPSSTGVMLMVAVEEPIGMVT